MDKYQNLSRDVPDIEVLVRNFASSNILATRYSEKIAPPTY